MCFAVLVELLHSFVSTMDFHSQSSNRWDVKVRAEELIRFSPINEHAHCTTVQDAAKHSRVSQGLVGTWCISDCALVLHDLPTFYCKHMFSC